MPSITAPRIQQDDTNVEYLAAIERSIGMFHLARHWRPNGDAWIYEVFIDGALLMSNVSPLSERELARQAIAAHGGDGPLRVLIGGLGLGHTAQAALVSPRVEHVRVVDAMDFVIGWMEQGLLPLSGLLTGNPRVEIVQSDMYADLLAEPTEPWDLILVDIDHAPDMPLDPSSLPFYTADGQRRVARHLAPGGILAVWSAFDSDPFDAVMREVYASAWREEVAWTVPYDDGDDQHLVNTLFFGRLAP